MNLDIKHEENITLITVLDSRLDASIAPEFKSEVIKTIQQGEKNIILDISSIKFMDSSSLGAMVAILKTIENNGEFIITGASGVVLELFKLTRMDRVFTLANNIQTAKIEITGNAN